ncbi:hypothetical protein ASPACDRAFT_1892227 [Aspergillus aculeatus ATCC 16872]|uniref:Arrestin-like N-terminal domain-containing protein n=1 Tax=Aspergillus aculeatus (strain ATCC 16872 / CBS 172.66 / WB 5094) TaxID=690307 RepID=A0A1L9WF24_ASPA1|nr:uncharacterized protein ASPACDRAFT_1892227 [Aspergillus aculeatus ATCC 16872]OJJ94707.1 hypothetical protein ASPACDRAFT_1892227 [Aspergillus aculeatus ATCC 16872]
MAEPRLRLDTPTSHVIFIHPDRGSYTLPLSGLLWISPDSVTKDIQAPSEITISLLRIVAIEAKGSARRITGDHRRYSLPFKRRMISPRTAPTTAQTYCETVLKCNLWSSPNVLATSQSASTDTSFKCLQFPFCVPVPDSLPATTTTALGTISYAMKATVTLASGESETLYRPLGIFYRLVQSAYLTTKHIRRFPQSPLTFDISITQRQPSHNTPRAQFSVSLLVRNLYALGDRAGEATYVIVNAVKWEVGEEAVLTEISNGDGQTSLSPGQRSTRALSYGEVKIPLSTSNHRQSNSPGQTDDRAHIQFDITIPPAINAVDDLDQESHCPSRGWLHPSEVSKTPAITVDHHLKIEVITGEDIVNDRTNRVLDRRTSVRSYGAIFPLRIHQLASSSDKLHSDRFGDELPAFEVAQSLSPPSYEAGLQAAL